jgi:hypothetical protein
MVTNPESQIAVPWTVNTEPQRVPALHVILLKRTYVLPWSRFIYAEGDLCGVVAAFTTHDVVVTGCGLDRLLADLAAQRVTTIRQPARTDKFLTAEAEVRIEELNVNEVQSPE